MEHPEERKSRVKEIFSDYGAALGGFTGTAWITGVPMALMLTVFAFFLAACFASLLFDQLSGMRSLPNQLRGTAGFVGSAIFGGSLATASSYAEQYADHVGVSSAVLAGVIVALVGTAWRQRWNERQLYRDTLLQANPEA